MNGSANYKHGRAGQFQIEETTGQLYWNGKTVLTEGRLNLGGFQAWVAGVSAVIVATESFLHIIGRLH